MTNPDEPNDAKGSITIHTGSAADPDALGSETTNEIGVFDPEVVPTNASARISGDDPNTLVVKFTAQSNTNAVVITPPADYLLDDGTGATDGNIAVTSTGADITPAIASDAVTIPTDSFVDGNTITVTINRLSNLEEGDEITLQQDDSGYTTILRVGGPAVSPTSPDDRELTEYKADTPLALTLRATAETSLGGGDEIVVNLDGFQVPDSIDVSDVVINGNAANAAAISEFLGNPESVAVSTVSGSKVVTLTLPITMPNLDAGATDPAIVATNIETGYSIWFKQSAGLKTPNSAGTKTITVKDRDDTDEETMVEITSHISLDSSWVSRGKEVKVTGKGINNAGDATAHLYSGEIPENDDGDPDPMLLTNLQLVESSVSLVLGRAPRDEGTVIVEGISTSRSNFIADAEDAKGPNPGPAMNARGVNLIVMVDSAGVNIGYAYLGILPSVSLDRHRCPAYRPGEGFRLRLVLREFHRPHSHQRNNGRSPGQHQ